MKTTLDAYLHNKLSDTINEALQNELNHNNFDIFSENITNLYEGNGD